MQAQSQIRLHASGMEMAQLVRGLTWCQRLFNWSGSLLVSPMGDPIHRYEGCWDARREQVRRQPAESAIDLVAMQGPAAQSFLLYRLLP